ncbi:MAG: glycerol-3-phosphate acyltransferase [Chloroflexota bacterium]
MLAGVATLVGAYLIGSIPVAYLLSALVTRRDIREMGSGNVGALNAHRSLGMRYGLLVLALDIAKGAFVMLAAVAAPIPAWAMYGAAVAVMAGHNWPVYIGFRGGKGAAVLAGISIVVLPVFSLLSLPAAVLGYWATRSAFWGLFTGLISINALIIVTLQPIPQIALCVGLTLLVGGTHMLRAAPELWPAIKARDFRRIGEIE